MKTRKSILYSVFVLSVGLATILSACSPLTILNSASQQPTPVIKSEAEAGSINGWVWHDQCDSGLDGQAAPTSTPPGCIDESSPLGAYHADGVLDANEYPIEGIVVNLRAGNCSFTDLAKVMAQTTTLSADISYSFTGLKAGTYCVSIDPQEEPNLSLLRPGLWTYPSVTEGILSTTVTLSPGENKFDVNFGWDHQFK